MMWKPRKRNAGSLPSPLWRARFLAFLVVVTLLAAPVAGQELPDAYHEAHGNYLTLYQEGRYQEAIVHAEAALEQAVQTLGEENAVVANLFNDLAALYSMIGAFDKAEPLFRRAIDIRRVVLGPFHPHLAVSLSNLSELLFRQERVDEALVLLRVSVAIRAHVDGADSPQLIPYFNALALMRERVNDPMRALALRRRALAMAVMALGATHDQTALQMELLGGLLERLEQFGEAESLYHQALAVRLRPDRPHGPRLASTMTATSRLMIMRGAVIGAEVLLREALAIWERTLGPDHMMVALALNNLGALYSGMGNVDAAEKLYRRALGILRANLPANHPDLALSLNNLAYLYRQMGRFADAEPMYHESLKIRRQVYGSDHLFVAESLGNLATLYQLRGRHAEAVPLYREALGILEASFGDASPKLVVTINNLALSLGTLNQLAAADALFGRARAILESTAGPASGNLANLLNNHAELLYRYYRLAAAEEILEKAREVWIANRQNPLALAQTLSNLASVRAMRGDFAAAEAGFLRVLEIRLERLGPVHPAIATVHGDLGQLYMESRDWVKAREHLETVIDIWTTLEGPESRNLLDPHTSLARLLDRQGNLAAAEHNYKRVLAMIEHRYGSENPLLIVGLDGLAAFLERRGRLSDAAGFRRRAVAILEAKDLPIPLAQALYDLARVEALRNRWESARALHERALGLRRDTLPADHWQLAQSRIAVAGLPGREEDLPRRLSLLEHALTVAGQTFGANHPRLAPILARMAEVKARQGARGEAATLIRRAERILDGAPRLDSGLDPDPWRLVRRIRLDLIFSGPRIDRAARDEAFLIGQRIHDQEAAIQRHHWDDQFADGDGDLAALARTRASRAWWWRQMDGKLAREVRRPPDDRDGALERILRRHLDEAGDAWRHANAEIQRRFTAYSRRPAARPVDLNTVQGRLAGGELLLVYLPRESETLLWAVRANTEILIRLPIGSRDLGMAIAGLRRTLDPGFRSGATDLPSYDTARAHDLWNMLVRPAGRLLEGVTQIRIVASGPLNGLPFAALVINDPTAEPDGPVTWLIDRYALSRLVAVSALLADRQEESALPVGPVLVFTDPLLDGPLDNRVLRPEHLFAGGKLADPAALHRLSRPPALAGELTAPAADVRSGLKMSEPGLQALRDTTRHVLVLSGPCVIGGPFSRNAQPAIVLTPPALATAENDGVVTASELARLDLRLDWLVLPGCRTRQSDGAPGAPGLDVLASGAEYGGARVILFSHWPVPAPAMARLLVLLREAETMDAQVPPAIMLQRALLRLRQEAADPAQAHPAHWAPLFLIGR